MMDLLADEGTVVLVDDGVPEAFGIPVVAHGIPEPKAEDVATVFLFHDLVVGGDGEVAGKGLGLGVGEQNRARCLALARAPDLGLATGGLGV